MKTKGYRTMGNVSLTADRCFFAGSFSVAKTMVFTVFPRSPLRELLKYSKESLKAHVKRVQKNLGPRSRNTWILRNACGQDFSDGGMAIKTSLAWPASTGALDIEPQRYLLTKHLQLFTEVHQG